MVALGPIDIILDVLSSLSTLCQHIYISRSKLIFFCYVQYTTDLQRPQICCFTVRQMRLGNYGSRNEINGWGQCPETVDALKPMDGHFLLNFIQLLMVVHDVQRFQFQYIAVLLLMILQSRYANSIQSADM